MKLIIVALALVAAAAALPAQSPTKEVEVVQENYEIQPDGSYKANFALNDGTHHEVEGALKTAEGEDGKPHSVIAVRGSYGYVNSNGENEDITYYADETGFHPEGKSIPKAQ